MFGDEKRDRAVQIIQENHRNLNNKVWLIGHDVERLKRACEGDDTNKLIRLILDHLGLNYATVYEHLELVPKEKPTKDA